MSVSNLYVYIREEKKGDEKKRKKEIKRLKEKNRFMMS